MTLDLAGRVAIVTGAGSGIGRAVAVRLAEAGATVVATSRTEEHLARTCDEVEQSCGTRPLGLVADVGDSAAVDAVVAATLAAHGQLDVLSNNAGIELVHGPPLELTTDEEWQRVLDVNVTGMFRSCRSALPHLRAGGSIMNMGSVNSFVGWPNNLAYTTSKGAVLMLTKALALEVAPREIRVNCVCPAIIDTPLTDSFLTLAPDPGALRAEYEQYAPLGRVGTAREVANCVAFLASDEASFVTGAALVVDGGATAR